MPQPMPWPGLFIVNEIGRQETFDEVHLSPEIREQMAEEQYQHLVAQNRAMSEAAKQTIERLKAMPWDERAEVVAQLGLDLLVLHGAGKFAGAALAKFISLSTEFKAIAEAERIAAAAGKATPITELGQQVAVVGKVAATEGPEAAKEVIEIITNYPALLQQEGKTATQVICNVAEDCAWTMPESGKLINGRWYTKHALERMAPDTIQVRAILSSRAIREGKLPGSDKFKSYVDPRGIPPIVVEDTIKNGTQSLGKTSGTIDFKGNDITVSINKDTGAVVTIIPK